MTFQAKKAFGANKKRTRVTPLEATAQPDISSPSSSIATPSVLTPAPLVPLSPTGSLPLSTPTPHQLHSQSLEPSLETSPKCDFFPTTASRKREAASSNWISS